MMAKMGSLRMPNFLVKPKDDNRKSDGDDDGDDNTIFEEEVNGALDFQDTKSKTLLDGKPALNLNAGKMGEATEDVGEVHSGKIAPVSVSAKVGSPDSLLEHESGRFRLVPGQPSKLPKFPSGKIETIENDEEDLPGCDLPPPPVPVDFEEEDLVLSAEEINHAQEALGRREKIITMFRANIEVVHLEAYSQMRLLLNPLYAWLCFVMPCMLRGAHQAEEAGSNTFYYITEKGLGTFCKPIPEDTWALPRNVGYKNTFIPWCDIILIQSTEEGGGVCSSSYLTVSISYAYSRKRSSHWHHVASEMQQETLQDVWFCKDADEVVRLLNEYRDRYGLAVTPRHKSSTKSLSMRTSRHQQQPTDSMDSLRSLRNMVDTMLPSEERDFKRIFVATTLNPHQAEVIHVNPLTDWADFLASIEAATGVRVRDAEQLTLKNGDLKVVVRSIADLHHDDHLLVDV